METAIRWSPSSNAEEQRFLIIDINERSFRLYKIIDYKENRLRREEIAKNTKVPVFRAFDWSASNEDLVGVGQWSGETTILSLNNNFTPLSLSIKSQRQCNAIAFNKTKFLATGLERVRNDFCLNVYDISSELGSHSSQISKSNRRVPDPIRQLASSESITSIKFFPSEPDNLIAGVKGTCLRIYDIRDNVAGYSLQFPTVCVHNIAIDPTDENYFASSGPPGASGGNVVQIWDKRSTSQPLSTPLGSGSTSVLSETPVLEIKKAFDSGNRFHQSTLWSLRYSAAESGCLGILSSHGQFRLIQTKKSCSPEDDLLENKKRDILEGPLIKHVHKVYVGHEHDVEYPHYDNQRGREEAKRIVAFDFTKLQSSSARPCVILLRGNQEVNIYEHQRRPPAVAVSAKNEISTSDDNVQAGSPNDQQRDKLKMRVVRSSDSNKYPVSFCTNAVLGEEYVIRQKSYKSGSIDGQVSHKGQSSQQLQQIQGDTQEPQIHSISDAIAVANQSRRWCVAGYLFDCEKNAEIVGKQEPYLQEMWGWIGEAKRLAKDEGMRSEIFDFSYVGIHGLWNSSVGLEQDTRTISRISDTCTIYDALQSLSNRHHIPSVDLPETSRSAIRILCLRNCGFAMAKEELEAKVMSLSHDGKHFEGAFLALLYNQRRLAYNALRNGNYTELHKTLSIAIMTFAKGEIDDEWWPEILEDMLADAIDPFQRGILSLLAENSWDDVIREVELPLRYNVGVALLHLNDDQLTAHFDHLLESAIRNGAVEGVLLTGLDDRAMSLFQTYIARTGDLQTAVLAMCHTAPLFLRDARANAWKEEYRMMMNSWKMFRQRLAFDVQSTRMATVWDGTKLIDPMPRQITLRCNNCDFGLHREWSADPPQPAIAGSTFGMHSGSIFSDTKSGVSCPQCGAHLPRCMICEHWIGVPNPHSRGGSVTASKKERLEDAAAFCMTCRHFTHAGHGNEWFSQNAICPAPDCNCRCRELDSAGMR